MFLMRCSAWRIKPLGRLSLWTFIAFGPRTPFQYVFEICGACRHGVTDIIADGFQGHSGDSRRIYLVGQISGPGPV